MKGPGLKLDLDVRRLWKCPQTGETIRLSGGTVAKSIQVEGETVFMKLVEEKRNLYRDPYHFDFAEPQEDDQSSSERAAAAARSIDTELQMPTEGQVVTEEPSSESVSAISDESESDTLSNENEIEANVEDDDDDSFGGGLL